ncbi:hypothetical protein IJ707_07260 [bacterium]|nr:hypothetical protein [bacterium]
MKDICLNWTISILTGLFSLFLMTETCFIFKLHVNAFCLPVAVIISVYIIICGAKTLKSAFAQLIILLDFILLTGTLCYFIPDFSYDGTTYHQAMIILMKWGLNPIYNNVAAFTNNQEYVFTSSIPYVENFLKFFEIIGANIYYVFNKIELTKITNYIFMLCAFCYSFYTLKNYALSNLKSSFFSFLLIYNPVCICQMLSNYVDGSLYYMFLILLFALVNYTRGFDNKKSLYLICISTVILSNLKLTGLFIALITGFIFLCLYRSKNVLISFFIAAALILITGINPYFTNIKQGRNPFYPVITNSIFDANREFMISSYPKSFENKNRFEKLFISLFAVSKNPSPLMRYNDPPKLKIPFTINGDDEFSSEDMRLAGFGYFFSGILLSALILSLFLRFKNSEDKKLFWVIITIILISVLGNHEAWWARFVPQLWSLPVFVLIFLFINGQKFKISYAIAGICVFNSLIINCQYLKYDINETIKDRKNISRYSSVFYISGNIPQKYHRYETRPIKLQEHGIKVIYTYE